MTRWARGQTRKEHDATSWTQLRKTPTANESQTNDKSNDEKRKPLSKAREKQQAARRLRRKKGKPCFSCRQPGHLSSECPNTENSESGTLCFICGSLEHTIKECRESPKEGKYPFAKCFICKQMGHLSGSCPDNPRGLYPDGGGCKFCGSVEHYGRDCPEKAKASGKGGSGKRAKYTMRTENESIDAIANSDDESNEGAMLEPAVKKKKVVKF